MTTITREVSIDASKEQVWKAIADFGNICHASPGVLKSHVTSQQQSGVGATRHCDLAINGATAEEKITEWNEGESFTVEAYEIRKMPGMKSMSAQFSIHEKGDQTVLRASLNYGMANFFFDVLNGLFVKRMNSKLWDSVLAGHKKYIETDEIVTSETPIDLKAVQAVG